MIKLCALCALISPIVLGIAIANAEPTKRKRPNYKAHQKCIAALYHEFPAKKHIPWIILECGKAGVVATDKTGVTYEMVFDGPVSIVNLDGTLTVGAPIKD